MSVEKIQLHYSSRSSYRLIAFDDENLKPITRDLEESLTMFFLWKERKEFTNRLYLSFIKYYYHREVSPIELNQLVLDPLVSRGLLIVRREKFHRYYTISDEFVKKALDRKIQILDERYKYRYYSSVYKQYDGRKLAYLPPYNEDSNT